MPLFALEGIIKIIIWIIEWILKKKFNDEELLKAFKQFSELARSENLKTIVARENAEKKLKEANAAWDSREKLEQQKKGIKK